MFSLNLNFFGAPKTTLQLASKERSKIPLDYRLLVILDQLQNIHVEMYKNIARIANAVTITLYSKVTM